MASQDFTCLKTVPDGIESDLDITGADEGYRVVEFVVLLSKLVELTRDGNVRYT